MAVSTTTFSERLKKIDSGQTTSWTVPGEGLADLRDERSFLSKSKWKVANRSTGKRFNPMILPVAALSGAASVIAARWLDFTFLDDALAFASDKGLDMASMVAGVPTALALAIVFSLIMMLILGLRRSALHVQTAGFMGAFLFEADLVALAPDIYAKFYPEAWVVDMMASATLVT